MNRVGSCLMQEVATLVSLALVLQFAVSTEALANNSRWKGHYSCSKGQIPVTLSLSLDDDGTGRASFRFGGNGTGYRGGEVPMTATYNRKAGSLILETKRHPQRHPIDGVVGNFGDRGKFNGRVKSAGCGEIALSRDAGRLPPDITPYMTPLNKSDAARSAGKSDFYWAVALRREGGVDVGLGVGSSSTEAEKDAYEKCKKGRSFRSFKTRCQVIASFASTDQACVSVINGSRRGPPGYTLFYDIVLNGERNGNARSSCNYAARTRTNFDCRTTGQFCTADAAEQFRR